MGADPDDPIEQAMLFLRGYVIDQVKGQSGADPAAPATAPVVPATAPAAKASRPAAPATASASGNGELSGANWASKFPADKAASTSSLDSEFAAKVDAFIAAMSDAGIKVHVIATKRSPERAYLLHWSWEISHNGVSAEVADKDKSRPSDVDIRWAHTKTAADGKAVFDSQASVAGAKALFNALGGDPGLSVAPALHSRHTLGRAIDMTTTWTAESVEITDGQNKNKKIKIEEKDPAKRNGMNPELWSVGESYGVRHFGAPDVSKAAHDRNHWSDNGH